MPFTPMAVRLPSGEGGHLDLTAQDAAYRPATIKQKVKQWQGEGGGVIETQDTGGASKSSSSKPLEKANLKPASPVTTPKKEHVLLHKEPAGPILPEGYIAKDFDVIRDARTGNHAVVKARSPTKPVPSKPSPTTWDSQRKVFVRKRPTKTQTEDQDEMKMATSPKKRVISDGHWRKDRTTSKGHVNSPAPQIVDEARKIITQKSTPDFRPKPIKPATTAAFAVRKAPERPRWMPLDPTKDSELMASFAKRQTQPQAVDKPCTTPSTTDKSKTPKSILRSPPLNTARPGKSGRASPESDSTIVPAKAPRKRHSPAQPRPSISVRGDEGETPFSLPSPGPDDSISRVGMPKSERVAWPDIGREPRNLSKPDPAQDSKVHVPPAKNVTSTTPKVFGGRIEAWLGGHKDPFFDEASSVADDRSIPSPIPEPLRPRKREVKKADVACEPLRTRSQARQASNGNPRRPSHHSKPRSPGSKENDQGVRQASYEIGDESVFNQSTSAASSPVGLGINTRRDFPTTGRPLSTIAASEVIQERNRSTKRPKSIADVSYAPSTISLTTIGNKTIEEERKPEPSMKRRLTKHEDLMTVLSIPHGSASLVSARSFRKEKLRADEQSKEEVLRELADEENKYEQELRLLVEGVVPTLLSNVLAKKQTGRSSGARDSRKQSPTQPIVDMGVALERLRTHHKRLPLTNPGALLVWAQNAARIYEEYIRVWQMGFDDVVVDSKTDLVSGKSNRVDVQHLLKRPLVRVKNLTRTFRAINHLIPSTDAQAMSERYHALMLAARKKSSDELARIEDEAAAAIDPTRARDLRSLAPLAGVRVDPSRSVRARDYFELHLQHSSGQQLDCAIELIIRDNEADPDKGGDVLFCEVSDSGRWLLFPPVIQEMVSARKGKKDLEIIMMIRGVASNGQDWSEVLTLHCSSKDAVDDWVDMLCDGPTPPSPTRSEFTTLKPTPATSDSEVDLLPPPLSPTPQSSASSGRPTVTFKSRSPSLKEVEIPIGEQARKTSKRWSFNMGVAAELLDQATPRVFKKVSGQYPPGSMGNRSSSRSVPSSPAQDSSRLNRRSDLYSQANATFRHEMNKSDNARQSRNAIQPNFTAKSAPSSPRSEYTESSVTDGSHARSPASGRPNLTRSQPTVDTLSTGASSDASYSTWTPSVTGSNSTVESHNRRSQDEVRGGRAQTEPPSARPVLHSRQSSTPSRDMPTIPRLRPGETQSSISAPSLTSASRVSTDLERSSRTPRPVISRSEPSELSNVSRDAPSSAPGKLQKFVAGFKSDKKQSPPQTPSRPRSGIFSTPNFLKKARPSSPLKRQYDPAAESAISDSDDTEDDLSDDDSLSSHSSDDESELYDHFSQAQSPGLSQIPQFPKATPPQSLASMSGPSLGPSNSASQGPYRGVPREQSTPATKAVANIFCWSDKGQWESLHPLEVTIVVSAGLIEAFTIADANSMPQVDRDGQVISPSRFNIAPLVALELTPLVPLRRGTALDISIRSPPTANSQIRSSANIMFRSRSTDECEHLYSLINQARINNATYIALQNARPHNEQGTWAAQMDKRNAMRSSSGNAWFGLGSRRGSTYRSNSVRKRQSSAMSESSVGTMNTAFSALRRLSGTWKKGENSTNSDSLESGYSTPNRQSATMWADPASGADLALGIKELKVRLYHREVGNKWRDMGSARLTIMLPDRPTSAGDGSPVKEGLTPPGPRSGGNMKRVLVKGTTKGETLLDETLGEGAFERVARTGIAVSVWKDNEGSTQAAGRALDRGGVGASWMDVFMIQMKSERDAAFTFALVGKLRY